MNTDEEDFGSKAQSHHKGSSERHSGFTIEVVRQNAGLEADRADAGLEADRADAGLEADRADAGLEAGRTDSKGPVNQGAPPAPNKGWTAWGATWLSILAASLVAVLSLALLSARSAREALEVALEGHVSSQTRLAALSFEGVPLEITLSLGGERSITNLRATLRKLCDASRLHNLAVLGPEARMLMDPAAERWIPEEAENDLIRRAAKGETVTGPLYRDSEGDLYLTAYTPIPNHPGWVLAAEGSGSSLGAVNDLRRLQLWVGSLVVVLAGLIGAILASLVVQPIRRLDHELSVVKPGDGPEALTDSGSREVRDVVRAARDLLRAIRERDQEIQAVFQRELEQISRMAAEVAHEVRNPLNAIALSAERLSLIQDPERQAKVVARIRDQIEQMEAIVQRWVHIAKPLAPQNEALDLIRLAEAVAAEIRENNTAVEISGPETLELSSDRVMVGEVLRNLWLNADQAGATRISVKISIQGGEAIIRSTDDGPGIPEEDIPKIFAWFHTTRAQGSGLGLPTSRRMMIALGGRLELVEFRPATFVAALPMEQA